MKQAFKKYRVKNKFRLVTFLLLIAMVLGTIGAAYVTASKNIGTYDQVCVQSNDTLWSIAQRCAATGQDIRDIVSEIMAINKLDDSSYIHPGDILLIPNN